MRNQYSSRQILSFFLAHYFYSTSVGAILLHEVLKIKDSGLKRNPILMACSIGLMIASILSILPTLVFLFSRYQRRRDGFFQHESRQYLNKKVLSGWLLLMNCLQAPCYLCSLIFMLTRERACVSAFDSYGILVALIAFGSSGEIFLTLKIHAWRKILYQASRTLLGNDGDIDSDDDIG